MHLHFNVQARSGCYVNERIRPKEIDLAEQQVRDARLGDAQAAGGLSLRPSLDANVLFNRGTPSPCAHVAAGDPGGQRRPALQAAEALCAGERIRRHRPSDHPIRDDLLRVPQSVPRSEAAVSGDSCAQTVDRAPELGAEEQDLPGWR
jgi:hypothetical protein